MALADTTDQLGGTGSILDSLRGIAVNGLSRGIDGYLSRKYPLTSFNEVQTVDAYGNPLPKGAPQTPIPVSLGTILRQPVVIGVGLATVVTLVIVLALRR